MLSVPQIQILNAIPSDSSNYLYSIYVCNNQVMLKKQERFQKTLFTLVKMRTTVKEFQRVIYVQAKCR